MNIIPRGDSRVQLMKHMLNGDNVGLCVTRQIKSFENFQHIFITNKIADMCCVSLQTSETAYVFPLYLYPEEEAEQTDALADNKKRRPNLDLKLVNKFAKKLKLEFIPDHEDLEAGTENTFHPLDLLDYIYVVLHSPKYRETYKEFLKIDFPCIPYPKNQNEFWRLVELGGKLRQLHLMEAPDLEAYISEYPNNGDNIITRKITKKDWELSAEDHGRILINDQQCFDKIPLEVWEFYIGGYQPAQKWLKDRHGRELSFDDILHYQKIIKAFAETIKIMTQIDEK